MRSRHRTELVLVLVQLEQLCPGWWPDLTDLAQRIGTDRASLNRTLTHLERHGLIGRASISNCGGTYLWWVKRSATDEQPPDAEPVWVLRDLRRNSTCRIPLTQRWEWGERHGVPVSTLGGFLAGHQTRLRNRWEVLSTPLDDVLSRGVVP